METTHHWLFTPSELYELLFRAVFKNLNSSTKGPIAFTVHWGNSVKLTTAICPRLNSPSLVEPRSLKVDEKMLIYLGSDQTLVLECVLSISSRKVISRFAARKIGPLNHARWLTLTIRLMFVDPRY